MTHRKAKLKKTAEKLGQLYMELKHKAAELQEIIEDNDVAEMGGLLDLDVKLLDLVAHCLCRAGTVAKKTSDQEPEA
jgi:hypothetical protein